MLAKQIQTVRKDDSFFETELRYWALTLENLREQVKTILVPIDIKENTKSPLVYPIQIVSLPSKLMSTEMKKTHMNQIIIRSNQIWQVLVSDLIVAMEMLI